MTNSLDISVTPLEVIDFLRRDLHLKEIYREIASQKIIKRVAQEQGVIVSPEEVQAELDNIRYQYRFDQPSQLLAWLNDEMATLSDIESRIQEKLLAQKLARRLFWDQIQRQFAQNRSDFEQILFYQIVVPYESLAREIFYQIEEEEISFFEAAHIYDIDETRRLHCGYAGKQLRWQLSAEIATMLQSAQVGEVVGPVCIAENIYAIFLIDEVTVPELTPEVADKLLHQMFQEWLSNQMLMHFNPSEEE